MKGHCLEYSYHSKKKTPNIKTWLVLRCFFILFVFCNRHYSLWWAQLYNSEALPFTYDQFVVIELADKLYNSVTVFFVLCQKYVFHIGRERVRTRTRGALQHTHRRPV